MKYLLVAVAIAVCCFTMWPGSVETRSKVELLIDQFHGTGYHFKPTYGDDYEGEPTTASEKCWGPISLRNYDFYKRITALEILAEMRPSEAAPAVPYLIDELINGSNDYDTGDGILPYRSTIAYALGRLRDERAIDPLIEKLKNPEKGNVPKRLQRIPGRSNPDGVGIPAIVEAIGRFGEKANHAAPWLRQLNGSYVDQQLKDSIEITLRQIGAAQEGATNKSLEGENH